MKKYLLPKLLLLAVLAVPVFLTMHAIRANAQALTPTTVFIKSANPEFTGWTMTSTDGKINCSSGTGTCQADYNVNDVLTLNLTPPPGMKNWGWSDPYAQCIHNTGNTCTQTIKVAADYDNIEFYPVWATYNLSFSMKGPGSGTIKSSDGKINCPGTCSATFSSGANVSLTATPSAGSTFTKWETPVDDMNVSYCFVDEGKGMAGTLTTKTCNFTLRDGTVKNQTGAIAYFDKATSTSGASNGTSSSSSSSYSSTGTTTPTGTTETTAGSTTGLAAPTLAGAKVNGSTVDVASRDGITVQQDKPLVLSGKTIPNGIVTLTIHSTPRTATVTADKDGNWSYTVSGLEPGQHHVDATVTDPVTKQTSASAQLLDFTLVGSTKPAANAASAAFKKSPGVLILAVVVLLVLAAAGTVFFLKRRKAKTSLRA